MEIVGLARDAVYLSLREPVPPTMYLPLAQPDEDGADVVDRPERPGGGRVAGAAHQERRRRGRRAWIAAWRSPSARSPSRWTRRSLQERLVAMLSGFFGALALLLAGSASTA